ncbi:MAG: tetratricopeptide repeat protein, partial [Pseudomonadota bacterium]
MVRSGMIAALVAAAMAAAPGGAAAQGLAGPYLAATSADQNNQYALAAEFYAKAVDRDQKNAPLLQNALVAMLAAGRFAQAEQAAERLAALEPGNQIAALTELAIAFRDGAYDRAAAIADDRGARMNPLLQGLTSGWAAVGAGDYDAALQAFDALDQNETLATYGQYHKALALALAGDFAAAASLLDGEDGTPLHVNRAAMIAHIASLSQSDQAERALDMAELALSDGLADRQMVALRDTLSAGQPVAFDVIGSASEGAAMVFSVIGSALSRDDASRFSLIYARLATLIWDGYDEARILAANVLYDQGQYDLAITAFAEIEPASPWHLSAEVGRAEAMQRAGRAEEAIEVLSSLSREVPGELSVLTGLGDIYRANERFEDANGAYTRALD